MVEQKDFGQTYEEDVSRLGGAIGKIEKGKEKLEKKELVKTSLKSLAESELLPEYMEDKEVTADAASVIKTLLGLVLHKGIVAGLKESRKYSPFIQDAFHDALADKLIPEMEKRGLLK